MSTAVHSAQFATASRKQVGNGSVTPVPDAAPEIIEERRQDAEGNVDVYKYQKGKLLGKVCT
jgi:hypothetical protein